MYSQTSSTGRLTSTEVSILAMATSSGLDWQALAPSENEHLACAFTHDD